MSGHMTSSRVRGLPRSGVREIMELALRTEGAIRLDIGDPDFDTPAHIVEAAAQAARAGFTHYGPAVGLSSLREQIVGKVARVNGFECSVEQVVVTVGGAGAIFVTLLALLDPGDEVLVPDPGWPNYRSLTAAASGVAVPYRLDAAREFEPDVETVEALIGPRTKAIFVNSPGNPTGGIHSADTLSALLRVAERQGLWVVSDECYDELVLEGDHVSAAALGGAGGQVVTVFSFSKTYAMTGWRVGYAVAPRDVAQLIALAQESVVSCPSTVAQKAAEAALLGPQEPVVAMRDAYRSRRALALARLDARDIGYSRSRGTFYLMVELTGSAEPSRDFARRLLTSEHVAVVPGSAFGAGGEGSVRLSLAAPEESVAAGVDRLADALQRAPGVAA
jgi:aspartate/methionine/tyrosine aminotransferase